MKTLRTIEEMRTAIAAAKRDGHVIGFVPTMGYLHEGHLSLVDRARSEGATFVVVSIFVNPTQFGPNEDFEKYPRDEKRDAELLEQRNVDLIFAPSPAEMYPAGSSTKVRVSGVSDSLEGERRPGHFDGVATVVLKLFNIVQADIAVFGEKDAQQCAVIDRMVRDLDIPVRLVFGRTVRESDGLAMSSRNAYLSPADRTIAPVLQHALRSGEERIAAGEQSSSAVEQAMISVAKQQPVQIDYLHVVDPQTFRAPDDFDRDLLVVGALRVGATRLIDNIRIPRPQTRAANSSKR